MLLQLGSRKCRRGKRSNAHYGRWVSAEVGNAVPARHDRARLLDFPECPGPRRAGLLYAKVCAKREDFWDATGARTFLSAATPEYPTGSERPRALLPFDIAADKNVRAPLWFRLRRPGDSAPYHGSEMSGLACLLSDIQSCRRVRSPLPASSRWPRERAWSCSYSTLANTDFIPAAFFIRRPVCSVPVAAHCGRCTICFTATCRLRFISMRCWSCPRPQPVGWRRALPSAA